MSYRHKLYILSVDSVAYEYLFLRSCHVKTQPAQSRTLDMGPLERKQNLT